MQRLLANTLRSSCFRPSINQSVRLCVRRYAFNEGLQPVSFARYSIPGISFNYLPSIDNQLSGSLVRMFPNGDPHESKSKIADKGNDSSGFFALLFAGVCACASLYFIEPVKADHIPKLENFQYYNNQDFLETKNDEGTPYFIKRPLLSDKLVNNVLLCSKGSIVMNIIAKESIGKSTMVKIAAKRIANGLCHVFYVDAGRSLKRFFSKNGIGFDDEMKAANALIELIEQYARKFLSGKKMIVIIDNADGIADENDPNHGSAPQTIKSACVRKSFVEGLKQCLADYPVHIYCITSPSNTFFAKECKRVLGDDAYFEVLQEDWIDFQLLDAEMDELIAMFEEFKLCPFKFSEEEKKALKSSKKEKGKKEPIYIGSFIKKMISIQAMREK